ncbi:MAG: hypothetical protein K2N21_06815 [Rikenellaceae bacterium]|nr:hypothetical protein [Rikenellaceae bacterium]
MKILPYLMMSVFVLTGCRAPVMPAIDVAVAPCDDTLHYSDVVSRVGYVTLDTEGKVPLGRIVCIERGESYIFLTSTGVRGVLQFDAKGRLVRRVPLPEGDAVSSLAVDRDHRLLLVGCGHRVHIYNFAGRHLRTVPLSQGRWTVHGPQPGYMHKLTVPPSDDIDAEGFRFVEVANYRDSAVNSLPHRDTMWQHIGGGKMRRLHLPLLYGYDAHGSMEVLSTVNDTIFAVDRSCVRPVAVISRGGDSLYTRTVSLAMPRRIDPAWYHIESMMSTFGHIYLRVRHNDSLSVVAYDRADGSVRRYRSPCTYKDLTARFRLFDNDYDGGAGAWGDFALADGSFATVIYPRDIARLRRKGLFTQVKSKDLRDELARAGKSPIVMFIYFK